MSIDRLAKYTDLTFGARKPFRQKTGGAPVDFVLRREMLRRAVMLEISPAEPLGAGSHIGNTPYRC